MYLVYADECGDAGAHEGGTPFFIISGLLIHENDWNDVFAQVVSLRQRLRSVYGLPQRMPWHAYDLVNGHGEWHHTRCGLSTKQRLQALRDILAGLAKIASLRVLNVVVRKDRLQTTPAPGELFERGWSYFVQRCHNCFSAPGSRDSGLLFTDRTQDERLRKLMRRMRVDNPVPSMVAGSQPRQVPIKRLLDDPVPRASDQSYFVQAADLIGFSLARRDWRRTSLTRYGVHELFDLLDPILLKEAARDDPQGIVYWPK